MGNVPVQQTFIPNQAIKKCIIVCIYRELHLIGSSTFDPLVTLNKYFKLIFMPGSLK